VGATGERSAERVFTAGPEAPGLARRFLTETLAGWGLPYLVTELNLAVSELVTNAFLHGRGDIAVRLTLSSMLRLAVHDYGAGQPAIRQYSSTATTGRGMHLVDSLCDRWGTTAEGTGKWVWLERDLDGSRAGGALADPPKARLRPGSPGEPSQGLAGGPEQARDRRRRVA
jgi:anti-sigma regulatory factor (Ser/Thr protein kinase)